MIINKRTLFIASAILLPVVSFAGPKTFNIVGEKLSYRNLATVESESEFETFTGKTTAVSGSIKFDPQKKTGAGSLVIDAKTIDTGIALRNDHMNGAGWLDTAKYPTIKFVTTNVKSAGGDNYTVTGTLTLHGVTKKVTTSVRLRYRAAGADTQRVGFDGDVVQVFAKINVKLADYGIKIPEQVKGKVAPQVTLTVSAYGVAK